MLSGAVDQRVDGHKQIAREVVSGLMGAPAWNGGMPEEGREQMKTFSLETRQKMSEAAKARCNAEWREKKSKAYETKLDTAQISAMYDSGMTQQKIAEALGVTQRVIWRHMKNYGIKARVAKKRNQTQDKNHMWKGDAASYKAFHVRVAVSKGKAKDYGCSVCGTTDKSKWYDWANLTGRYYDIDDYKPMCRQCHRQYDRGRGDQNA